MKRHRKLWIWIVVVISLLIVTGVVIAMVRPAGFVALVENRPVWQFDGNEWRASGTAPACEEPLTIAAPMDMERATSRLDPGQMRGTDFKPHGGLAIDTATETDVTIYAIRDAKLVRAARYIENGAEQYLLDFIDPCGIMYRYDHLAKLSSELAAYTDPLETKEGDTRTVEIDGPMVQRGSVIATAVGLPGNVFFDLGVYDLRQQNAASRTELYRTDQLRIADKEQSFYAVCWFNLLLPADRTIANALPTRANDKEGTVSDYCPAPQD